MEIPNKKQQQILSVFLEYDALSSSKVHEFLIAKYDEKISLVTVKRELSQITRAGFINANGRGRARTYKISTRGRIIADVDAHSYCSVEPDQRHGLDRFNFELLPSLPDDLFTARERTELENATQTYHQRTANLPPAIAKKELERLIIELSWKSSKIEGNTYTLLDTEKLILENKEAPGHDKKEMIMILNHKDAFNFIHDHPKDFTTLTYANLEELHKLVVKNLSIGTGLRKKQVGVIGSIYQPLDNEHQVREAIAQLSATITRMNTPYEKALMALAGLSYIQPFEDGNKRTARLMTNALLLAYTCAPLSYRSIEESVYREATLVFYELNSIIPFKEIFMSQYVFAAHHYAII